jgi:ubiquinone/menaquinone biosynthesis C-methylase UbiE
MKLNAVEKAFINNPVRDVFLRRTLGWLRDATCAPRIDRALEIGCGQGSGLVEIARMFHPRAIDGFDLDAKQVELARARIAATDVNGTALRAEVGDAERIDADDASYDAVFEFTIFHHVPDWRRAISEVHRVLRPGGFFLFEELSEEFFRDVPILSPLLRRFTVHPWDTMFDFPTFRQGLADGGLRVTALYTMMLPGWHLGVAVRD